VAGQKLPGVLADDVHGRDLDAEVVSRRTRDPRGRGDQRLVVDDEYRRSSGFVESLGGQDSSPLSTRERNP
jgi:hypothetical protein